MSWTSTPPRVLGGVQAGDLGAHLLGNGQTGGVVTGAVDLVAGGQLLQVLGDSGGVQVVVAISVHRYDIVLDSHFIARGRSAPFRNQPYRRQRQLQRHQAAGRFSGRRHQCR